MPSKTPRTSRKPVTGPDRDTHVEEPKVIFELTYHQTAVLNAVVKQLLEDACVTLAPHAKADITSLYKAIYVIPAADEKPYPRPIDSVLPAIEL